MRLAQYFISAKVLAVGPRRSYSVCIGQADFENGRKVYNILAIRRARLQLVGGCTINYYSMNIAASDFAAAMEYFHFHEQRGIMTDSQLGQHNRIA